MLLCMTFNLTCDAQIHLIKAKSTSWVAWIGSKIWNKLYMNLSNIYEHKIANIPQRCFRVRVVVLFKGNFVSLRLFSPGFCGQQGIHSRSGKNWSTCRIKVKIETRADVTSEKSGPPGGSASPSPSSARPTGTPALFSGVQLMGRTVPSLEARMRHATFSSGVTLVPCCVLHWNPALYITSP